MTLAEVGSVGEFLHSLGSVGPMAARLMEAHLATYEEWLPHVLCGALSLEMVRVFGSREPTSDPDYRECVRILDLLEAAIQSEDPAVRDLVQASFLENVADRLRGSAAFRRALGRTLHRNLSRDFDFDDPGRFDAEI